MTLRTKDVDSTKAPPRSTIHICKLHLIISLSSYASLSNPRIIFLPCICSSVSMACLLSIRRISPVFLVSNLDVLTFSQFSIYISRFPVNPPASCIFSTSRKYGQYCKTPLQNLGMHILAPSSSRFSYTSYCTGSKFVRHDRPLVNSC